MSSQKFSKPFHQYKKLFREENFSIVLWLFKLKFFEERRENTIDVENFHIWVYGGGGGKSFSYSLDFHPVERWERMRKTSFHKRFRVWDYSAYSR